MLLAQANQVAASYSLKNLQLEYETIANDQLASEITNMYSLGVSIPFEDVTMFQKVSWGKNSLVQNLNVNVPRKSMKAVVLLFKDDSADSESYVYPNLKAVEISIEGKPNQVNSRDLITSRLYEEAHTLFSTKNKYDQNLSIFDFYKDSFACVTDLRSKI